MRQIQTTNYFFCLSIYFNPSIFPKCCPNLPQNFCVFKLVAIQAYHSSIFETGICDQATKSACERIWRRGIGVLKGSSRFTPTFNIVHAKKSESRFYFNSFVSCVAHILKRDLVIQTNIELNIQALKVWISRLSDVRSILLPFCDL